MELNLPNGRLRIGTRESRLARVQAERFRRLLIGRFDVDPAALEVVTIRTTGDAVQDRPLYEIGGKGLFVRELDDALLAGKIDVAVHSMKDRPGHAVSGIRTCCYLKREDVRDTFVSLSHATLGSMPEGSRIGTSSPRRRSQIMAMRQDLEVVAFRGNVETRLRKLDRGDADATILAMAGLQRLDLVEYATAPFDPGEMLPALCQGAIGIDAREDDCELVETLSSATDQATAVRMMAERAFLESLGGSCRSAIAGLAELTDSEIRLCCEILHPSGWSRIQGEINGPSDGAGQLGVELADRLQSDPRANRWLKG